MRLTTRLPHDQYHLSPLLTVFCEPVEALTEVSPSTTSLTTASSKGRNEDISSYYHCGIPGWSTALLELNMNRILGAIGFVMA